MTTDQHPAYSDQTISRFINFCKTMPKDKLVAIIYDMMLTHNTMVWELEHTAGELDVAQRTITAHENGWLQKTEE